MTVENCSCTRCVLTGSILGLLQLVHDRYFRSTKLDWDYHDTKSADGQGGTQTQIARVMHSTMLRYNQKFLIIVRRDKTVLERGHFYFVVVICPILPTNIYLISWARGERFHVGHCMRIITSYWNSFLGNCAVSPPNKKSFSPFRAPHSEWGYYVITLKSDHIKTEYFFSHGFSGKSPCSSGCM